MPFDFGIKDIIDILLVALMLYYVYRLMKESRSLSVFGGIMVFVLVWLLVSQIFEMRLMGSILDKLVSVGVIGLVVLFQEEIRKFLYSLGGSQRFRSIAHFFRLRHHKDEVVEDKETIMPIVMACMNMARQKVGALIVMERSVVLDDVVETGDRIDARINQRLIENIFFKNSPLHDGAMIISKKRIKAAGREPRFAHSEGTRPAPPCRDGYFAGERCPRHRRFRGNRSHQRRHSRPFPPAPLGRGTGSDFGKGSEVIITASTLRTPRIQSFESG